MGWDVLVEWDVGVLEPAFRGLLAGLKIIQKLTVLKGQNSREFFFRVFLCLKFRGLLACLRILLSVALLKGQNARKFFFQTFRGQK